jgi:hypothetical protein
MSVDTTHTHSSSPSAIEPIPTSATIIGTPNSPSLLPSSDSHNSLSRRRISWGLANSADPPPVNDPGPSSSCQSTPSQPVSLDGNPYDDQDPYASSASATPTPRLRDSSPTSTFDDFNPAATLRTTDGEPSAARHQSEVRCLATFTKPCCP